MNTPNDPPQEPAPQPEREMTREEFEAWLMKNPDRANALIDVVQSQIEKKRGEMTAEQIEELKAVQRKFEDELADYAVPEQYNPLADRLRVLTNQKQISEDEVEEVRQIEKKLGQLIDMALSDAGARRTHLIHTAMEGQKQGERVIAELVRSLDATAFHASASAQRRPAEGNCERVLP